MRGYKRIRVFPDRDLRATRLEVAVMDCRVVQRLREIRQLGQSHLVFPTAEHSRFAHVLGVLYWSAKMLSYIRENHFADQNVHLLERAEVIIRATALSGYPSHVDIGMEIPYLDQLARLFALTHDLTHLPFGHTLEDQAGIIKARHDENNERIRYFFERLISELADSPHLAEMNTQQKSVAEILLRECEAIFFVAKQIKEYSKKTVAVEAGNAKLHPVSQGEETEVDRLPYRSLVSDLINNTICADLVDYLQRDLLQCGMPWTIDKALLSHLKVFEAQIRSRGSEAPAFRLGVAVGRNGKLRHDVVTAVLALLRARYDVTEKVYYHHTKCAADAMLEKVLRDHNRKVSWHELGELNLGDEGFLEKVARELEPGSSPSEVLSELRSRRFHKGVFKLRGSVNWSATTRKKVSECEFPEGRSELEAELCERCKLPLGAIIVSCLPRDMQLKEAAALVEWPDGEVLPLSELPRKKNYLLEVAHLTDRYRDLWSLTVYLRRNQLIYAGLLEGICERIFDQKNDPLMAGYVRRKYLQSFAVKRVLEEITESAEVEAIPDLNVAFGGGAPEKEADIEEVLLDHLEETLRERRGKEELGKIKKVPKGRGRRPKKQPKDKPAENEMDSSVAQLELGEEG